MTEPITVQITEQQASELIDSIAAEWSIIGLVKAAATRGFTEPAAERAWEVIRQLIENPTGEAS